MVFATNIKKKQGPKDLMIRGFPARCTIPPGIDKYYRNNLE